MYNICASNLCKLYIEQCIIYRGDAKIGFDQPCVQFPFTRLNVWVFKVLYHVIMALGGAGELRPIHYGSCRFNVMFLCGSLQMLKIEIL